MIRAAAIALAVFLTLLPAPANATELSGVASVVDGDTIIVGGTRIRLHGIDAPELKQTCSRWSGEEWACGTMAKQALEKFLAAGIATCTSYSTDRYGRTIAKCAVGDRDAGEWLIRNGWAIAYRRYSLDYVIEEDMARKDRSGIWGGPFVEPSVWRSSRRH